MNDLQRQLATTLGPAYRLERELGGGGMSRVFLAVDAGLNRSVVVKVLLPELASGMSVDRFKREITLAARLQHPHIVPLLSAGESSGLPFFTMPLVEGESLRARLSRAGELPVAEAVRLLREVASALAYAHGKGVVHRDIKPENVLLSGSHAMVTDFGVAKALALATGHGDQQLTETGMALGTPAYMAPEQAAGDAGVDHRSDLYAWGILAYELLTGQPPFAGRPTLAIVAAHFAEMPEPIGNRRPGLPAPLAALVMRCLAKRPADRPQSAADVLAAIDELAATPSASTPAAPVRPTVAVLPMVNTSGDPANEHFSDGLTDELIGALGKVESLTVTGRTSSFALKGQGLDIRAVAEKLRVASVLEGSVRRAGNRLKASVQLVNADGTVVWSDTYDRLLEDVFAVQEEIAQAVVTALAARLGAPRGPLVRPPTTDINAYDLYLKGRFVRRRMNPADLRRAIGYFEQAIALDPSYAPAYAWLSDCHWLLPIVGAGDFERNVPLSRSYAARALALDPQLAEAHWAQAQPRAFADRDWAGSQRDLQTALRLDPGLIDARHLYGLLLLHLGRAEESMAELTQVLAADPLLAEGNYTMGRACLTLGLSARAISHFRDTSALQPGFFLARVGLGHAYFQSGDADAAVAEFEQAAAMAPPGTMAQLAYAYGRVGRTAEAHAIVDRISAGEEDLPPFDMAMASIGLGRPVEALGWLERGALLHDPWTTAVDSHPAFEPIRHEPRYGALLRTLGIRV